MSSSKKHQCLAIQKKSVTFIFSVSEFFSRWLSFKLVGGVFVFVVVGVQLAQGDEELEGRLDRDALALQLGGVGALLPDLESVAGDDVIVEQVSEDVVQDL